MMEPQRGNVNHIPAFLAALAALCNEYGMGFDMGRVRLVPLAPTERQVVELADGPSVRFSLTKEARRGDSSA